MDGQRNDLLSQLARIAQLKRQGAPAAGLEPEGDDVVGLRGHHLALIADAVAVVGGRGHGRVQVEHPPVVGHDAMAQVQLHAA